MHKATKLLALLASFALMLTASNSLAAASSTAKDSTTNMQTNTKKSQARSMNHRLASAEEISGTVAFVGPSDKEMTLMGANGVPYDFHLTSKTKVDLGSTKIGPTELANESNQQAIVRFIPTSRGNMAQSVMVSAGT